MYTNAPTTKPRRRWMLTAVVAAGTFAVGSVIGSAIAADTTTPAPEPEVVTETQTVTEYVVPDACLYAITDARAGFAIAAEVVAVIGPAVEAAYYRDVAGLEAATADLDALNVQMSGLDFIDQAAACEAAAQ